MDVKINDLVTTNLSATLPQYDRRADRMNALNEDVILCLSKLGNT